MSSKYLVAFSLVFAVWSSTSQAALDRVSDFALLDDSGEFHQLSRYQHRRALAVMSYVEECSSMASRLEQFKVLQSAYADKGIEFVLIDSQDLERVQLHGLDTDLPVF